VKRERPCGVESGRTSCAVVRIGSPRRPPPPSGWRVELRIRFCRASLTLRLYSTQHVWKVLGRELDSRRLVGEVTPVMAYALNSPPWLLYYNGPGSYASFMRSRAFIEVSHPLELHRTPPVPLPILRNRSSLFASPTLRYHPRSERGGTNKRIPDCRRRFGVESEEAAMLRALRCAH